jgi:endonuclease YncB( thermonuclease family)/methylphosphotriester-DNA--protein-cysteine methyltransferase
MKTYKVPFVLVITLFLSLFCVAQQPVAPVQVPQSPVAVSNNVQLVIEGKVINVHDGDTITVLDQNNKKFHIRLQGIDAPELKQEFGSVSQQNLSRMVLGKQVTIVWTKVDKYRRTVGTIRLDGQDINIEQVKAGMAWHFKKYEDEQEPQDRVTYAAAEQQARAANLGLWKYPNPMVPGEWRQEVKAKRWGPPPPEGTIVGNKNSMKYHRPDCSGYRDMAEKNRVFFKTVEEAEAAGYKRAGNCPAPDLIATARPVSVKPAATPTAETVSATVPVAATASTPTDSTTEEAEEADDEAETTPATTPAAAATPTGATPPNNLISVTVGDQQVKNVPALSTSSDDKVIGNKNSKVYHLPGCSGYARVSEKNQVKFDTAADAEKAGYRLAGNCHPEDKTAASEAPASPATGSAAPTPSAVPAQTTPAAPAAGSAPAETQSPTTPMTDPAAASPSTVSTSATSSDAKVIGNKNSKIYHLPGCSGYTRVSEKNQVKFDTAADAEKAGFRLAKNCSANQTEKP